MFAEMLAACSRFSREFETWRKQYGRQLASELARSYCTLHAEHLRRKLLVLIDHYPQGLMVLVLLRLMPGLGRRNARVCSLGAMDEKPLSQRFHAWLNAAKPHSPKQIG